MRHFLLLFLSFFLLVSDIFSEFYAEIYTGALFEKINLSNIKTYDTYSISNLKGDFDYSIKKGIDPVFWGGFKIGKWFSNIECCNRKKYFGCSLDFNAASLDYNIKNPLTSVTYQNQNSDSAEGSCETIFSTDGYVISTSFLLNIRSKPFVINKGYLKSIYPFLELGPTLGVFRSDSSFWIKSHTADGNELGVYIFSDQEIIMHKKTYVSAGFTSDLGVRLMICNGIFFDTFFKYCYLKPTFKTSKIKYSPDINFLGLIFGLGYSF